MIFPDDKYSRLKSQIPSQEGLAVAFSGGVDSALLLWAAREVLGYKVLALTARLRSTPESDLDSAKDFCRAAGIEHMVVDIDELALPAFRENPPHRCYHCKKHIFARLLEAAGARGFNILAEGSNTDDLNDWRPGRRAVEELGVISPLLEAGLNKKDIRELSRGLGLPQWDRPAGACLASRIPYGQEITEKKLSQVEKAEAYIASLGCRSVRVRHRGDLALIQAEPEKLEFLTRPDILEVISAHFRKLGFQSVAIDPEGLIR